MCSRLRLVFLANETITGYFHGTRSDTPTFFQLNGRIQTERVGKIRMKIGYQTLLPLALITVSAVVIILALHGPLRSGSSGTALTGTWVEVPSSHPRGVILDLATLTLKPDGRFAYVGYHTTQRGRWKVIRPSMIRLEYESSRGSQARTEWITIRQEALCFDSGFMIQEICFHQSQSS